MEKIVASGEQDCTVELDGTECAVVFSSNYKCFTVQNETADDIYISVSPNISAGKDGVRRIGAGASGAIAHGAKKTLYILGSGSVQVTASDSPGNFFKPAPAAGGGEADAYTKSESDARYPLIADVVPYKMGMDFGKCADAASTTTKTVTTLNNVAPKIGAVFAVRFANAVPANAMLRVNNLSGYMQYRGGNLPQGIINAGDIVTFMYYMNTGFNRFEILSIENGGNADTVDGKHASDFVSSSTTQQVSNSRVELPNNVNVAEWLVQNAKIGTQYFRTDGAVGQTNLPGGLNTWMWFTYDGNRHFARAWTSAAGTTEFILNYVNGIGGWKEISCTPIKSTTFSGTTNEYGNVVFTAVGSKIPLFAECSPYCGIPLRFNDNYWIHCINPITNNNSVAANTAVTGTVYYVEI